MVVAVFVVPAIKLNRYRASVTRALKQALGRDVSVRRVGLRVIPPGLTMDGVVIADDPSISAEPMLRADKVTASLRWTSLWRGRLEIARISLSYPSFNLARAADGRWNLPLLLERARQTPSAPTTKSRPEARSRFPYIELLNARINLKLGNEKKVYALSDADFAVWQASEHEWRIRLQARPVRTDSNLSDTGRLKLAGSFGRAASLPEMPVSLRLYWEGGQLGQLTTLVYGRDRGWRGTLQGGLSVTGTLNDLRLAGEAGIDDFRRYDILTGDSLRLTARCTAHYNFATHQLADIACQGPPQAGVITARGDINLRSGVPAYDLTFTAEHVPLAFALAMARHMKADMPSDLAGSGIIDAVFTCRSPAAGNPAIWSGSGSTSTLQLRSSVVTRELELEALKFDLLPASTGRAPKTNAPPAQLMRRGVLLPHPGMVRLHPFRIDLGGETRANVSASFSRESYAVDINGSAGLDRLLQIGRMLALPVPAQRVEGAAKIDLEVAGRWAGFTKPVITGTAQLRGVTAEIDGFATPAKITSAMVTASPQSITFQNLNLTFPGARTTITGTVGRPRACAPSPECKLTFTLAGDQLALDDLNRLLNPKLRDRPWYALWRRFRPAGNSPWQELYATGQVSARRFTMKTASVAHASARLKLAHGTLTLAEIRGDLFGGNYTGELTADFTGAVPSYTSKGVLQHISLTDVAALMNDAWASGTASITYRGQATGWGADELLQTAGGAAAFDWTGGSLQHLELDGGPPLQIRHFTGTLELARGVFTLGPSKLETPTSIYQVSGTASLGRDLELTLARDGSRRTDEARGFSIRGSLAKPKVSPLPLRQVQTKATGR